MLYIPGHETLGKLWAAYLSVLGFLHLRFPDGAVTLESTYVGRDHQIYHGPFAVYTSLFYRPRNALEVGVRTGTWLLLQMSYNLSAILGALYPSSVFRRIGLRPSILG